MDKVIVMMSTYNGEHYLEEQLASILSQTNVIVDIYVRDDGSNDNTIGILREYSDKGLLHYYLGSNIKPAKSFLDLMRNVPKADYYAFSDQDDVWLPNKLSKALSYLKEAEESKPALYYSKATLVDSDLSVIKQNEDRIQSLTFPQALISSNATGCTMVFNQVLLDLVNKYRPNYYIMHDAWLHKICLAANGSLYYDDESSILYRQHSNNVVGGSTSFSNRWKRRFNTVLNNPRSRSRGIEELMLGYRMDMTEENINYSNKVIHYRDSIINRLKLIADSSIRTGNVHVDGSFILSVLLGVF